MESRKKDPSTHSPFFQPPYRTCRAEARQLCTSNPPTKKRPVDGETQKLTGVFQPRNSSSVGTSTLGLSLAFHGATPLSFFLLLLLLLLHSNRIPLIALIEEKKKIATISSEGRKCLNVFNYYYKYICILGTRQRLVEREFSSDEPFHPRHPPFRGTPNLTTRSQRLHHVAPVLSEPRQSSLVCPEAFFSSPRFPTSPPFPYYFLEPTGWKPRGSIFLSPNSYFTRFSIDFRFSIFQTKFKSVLFEELIKKSGIEINGDCIVENV